MSRFRLLLAWLMMAALPLQGWAAASMLYCSPAQRAAVAQAPEAAGHGHHDMHLAHHEASAGHHADADADPAPPEGAGSTADASSHTCGVCASCCHGVALAQTQRWDTAPPVPAADIAEPLIAVLARPSTVPDKPPRA